MDLDQDPLSFFRSPGDSGESKKEQEMADQQKPPDPLENLPPVQMKQGGTLGSLGLNLETYFAPDLKDPHKRTERLEKALIAVHKDLQVMAPSLQRLAGMESEIKNTVANTAHGKPQPLMKQSEGMVETTPPPAKVKAGSPVKPGPRAMNNSGKAIISGVRVGQHSDKIRVVFDATQKTDFSADLDNAEKLLVVEFPNARWDTPSNFESFGKMPVLKSYKVDSFNDDQGNIFVLQLKQETQVLAQSKYPPLSGPGERIVIDLKR